MKEVFVDARTRDEVIVLVVDGKKSLHSLTPYLDKGWIKRKTKRNALEPECCAIHLALTIVDGDIVLGFDRNDLVDHLNGIESPEIERKLDSCISEIKERMQGRKVVFKWVPRESNPASSLGTMD
jgi:hypothetical protein